MSKPTRQEFIKQAVLRGDLPRVELHGFDPNITGFGVELPSNLDAIVDITDRVQFLQWSPSTREPYGSGTIRLAIPFHDIFHILPGALRVQFGERLRIPEPGFWVVLRYASELTKPDAERGSGFPAVYFAKATGVSFTFKTDQGTGAHQTSPVEIKTAQFLAPVRQSRFALVPDAEGEFYVPGYVYSLRKWLRDVLSLLESLVEDSPGESLSRLYYSITPHLLPSTLIALAVSARPTTVEALAFGKNVPLVWDRRTCARWSPMRSPQMIRVSGSNTNALRGLARSGTTWDLLRSSFQADRNLVEFFPSLEFPCLEVGSEAWRHTFVETVEDTIPVRNTDLSGEGPVDIQVEGADYLGLSSLGAPVRSAMTTAGKALGSQPVMIYRVKPTLTQAVSSWDIKEGVASALRRARGLSSGERLSTEDQARVNAVKPTFAENISYATGRGTSYGQEPAYLEDFCWSGWQTFLWSEISSFSVRWSDEDRVNAVYTRPPQQERTDVSSMGLYGQPVFKAADILAHGLRLKEINWPFLPSSSQKSDRTAQTGVTLDDIQSALSEIHFSQLGCESGAFFGAGEIVSDFRPFLSPGNWVWGDLQDQSQPDGVYSFVGYAHTLTHTVSVSEDREAGYKITARTKVMLERMSLLTDPLVPNLDASSLRKSGGVDDPPYLKVPVAQPTTSNLPPSVRDALSKSAFSGGLDGEEP